MTVHCADMFAGSFVVFDESYKSRFSEIGPFPDSPCSVPVKSILLQRLQIMTMTVSGPTEISGSATGVSAVFIPKYQSQDANARPVRHVANRFLTGRLLCN